MNNEENLFRTVALGFMKDSEPSPSAFVLKSADIVPETNNTEGHLSVDWDRHSNANESMIRLGCTVNVRGEYKDPEKFNLYSLNIGLVKGIEDAGIDGVKHSPIKGHPTIPDNYSHCHIIHRSGTEIDIKAKRPLYAVKLREIAKGNKMPFDLEYVLEEIERNRATD